MREECIRVGSNAESPVPLTSRVLQSLTKCKTRSISSIRPGLAKERSRLRAAEISILGPSGIFDWYKASKEALRESARFRLAL